MVSRVHRVDAHGNLEWVERIIENLRSQKSAPLRAGKFHLTEQRLRELLRLAYRNGANEHEAVMLSALQTASKLLPGEKP